MIQFIRDQIDAYDPEQNHPEDMNPLTALRFIESAVSGTPVLDLNLSKAQCVESLLAQILESRRLINGISANPS